MAKKEGNTISKVNDEEIIALRKLGLLHKEIAKILGVATCTVTQHLNKLGYKTYDMNHRNEVLQLHQQGMTDKEISELLNITRANVTHLLNVQGITGRKSKIDNIELRNRISNSLIGRYTGENNPNYKGYINEKRTARGIFKTISKRLIRNNNYTCQHCGKRGGDLETHHIKPFIIIMNEFLKNVYDGNIDTLYQQLMQYPDFVDENNMVVLCHDCHWKIHYTDNHELSPYRWESATTIEKTL